MLLLCIRNIQAAYLKSSKTVGKIVLGLERVFAFLHNVCSTRCSFDKFLPSNTRVVCK
jgi:hypothetical protein